MMKINFKKAVAQKFKEYQKLEALTSINVFEVIQKVVHAKVLTEMKKLLPTYVPKAVPDYVKPRLNNSSNKTHSTHQKLYDTLYDSIILDQEALDAQDAKPSFHKRTHDDQDPSNNHEGENKKKRRKDACGSSSRSLRKDKAPMTPAPEDTPANQPQD
uniref:Uncharacterized protein n=1 Tax=Tanacetum cinerariifolium TaxID=118510 RepID=A0A6L2ML69_TANCI|nr:hypothetical protein [Tanacetum cinerariifolium]